MKPTIIILLIFWYLWGFFFASVEVFIKIFENIVILSENKRKVLHKKYY